MTLERASDSCKFWVLSIDNTQLKYKMQRFFDNLEMYHKFNILPASIKHHHAYKGGLNKHTAEVCANALSLAQDINVSYSRDDILLAALLHDVGKVAVYKIKDGTENEFDYTNTEVCSQEMFVMRMCQLYGIELSLDVVSAIEFAHGGWSTNIKAIKNPSKLAYLIHMADLWSSQFS